MLRQEIYTSAAGGLLIAGCVNGVAQKPVQAGQMDVDMFKILSSRPLIVDVVKGAPYAATATTETVQTLSDGNQIVQSNQSGVYRDSDGRTRLEQSLNTIGKWRAMEPGTVLITINDPVARTAFTLDPRTRTAQQNPIIQKPLTARWNGSFSINGKALSRDEFEALMERKRKADEEMRVVRDAIDPNDPNSRRKLAGLHGDKGSLGRETTQSKRESLGTQVMGGVEVIGTRVTVVIPAGEAGNRLPLEIIDESWYSPALQVNLMTKHRDPRSGETTYKLTNLSRSEPARELFTVPTDYTVKSAKPAGKPQ